MLTAERLIRERIAREGRLTFAAFMDAALYGPGGYYAERPALGGAGGDYYTSPELHPIFGALIGRQVAEVWNALGRPDRFDVVEHGPGRGLLCRDILLWARHDAPDFARAVDYVLVEPSAPLREAQRATLVGAGLLREGITWATTPVEEDRREVSGCVLANELIDAFPVHLVSVRNGALLERYVTVVDGALAFVEDAPSSPAISAYFRNVGTLPGEGCQAEVNLLGIEWIRRQVQSIRRGALIVLDYGYPARELYSPRRRFGTLLCYRGHSVGSDPLRHVGLQDITSHVDFTSLAQAAEAAGATILGATSQSALLRNAGFGTYMHLLERAPISATDREANRRAMLGLVDPAGLGRVVALVAALGLDDFSPSGLGAMPTWPEPAWLPLARPGQMTLPDPAEMDGLPDFSAQWTAFWTGSEIDD